jgi:PKD repeat protein
MRARHTRLALFAATLAMVMACDITSLSGPTQAQIGDLVTFVVGYSAGGIHGTQNDRSAFLAVDVPLGWTATSATYTGTVNGSAVSGNAVISSTDPGSGGGLPAVEAGYARAFFAAGPWSAVSGYDTGTGTISFRVGGSSGTYRLDFRAATNGGTWSVPTSQIVAVVAPCTPPSAPTASFTWSPAQAQIGQPVTFTDASTGSPASWSWRFGDGMTSSGQSVSHTFSTAGTYQVSLTAANCKGSSTIAHSLTVICGQACAASSVIVPDIASVAGMGSTFWRTDLRIFNPSSQATQVWLGAMPAGRDNSTPFQAGPYTLPARSTLVLNDVLATFASLGRSYTKAAIRITFQSPDGTTPVAVARTYTPADGGGTIGESVAGVPVWPGTTRSPQWLAGGRGDGLVNGFRTNLTMVNQRAEAATGVAATVLDANGLTVTSKLLSLPPYGYTQDTVADLFGAQLATLGAFALRFDLPPGTDVVALASVFDNRTGDPALLPGQAASSGPLFIPEVTHMAGAGSSTWRSLAQITNPDSVAHTWELRLTSPQVSGVISRRLTLGGDRSFQSDDLVTWLYSSFTPADQTGLLRIAPDDGSQVLPVVATKISRNIATGSYSSGLPIVSASGGASPTGALTHLYLTGMTSPDVAISMLGLVNLGDGSTVFSILFYDEGGNLLNPGGAPYTFTLFTQGLDRDRIENRFRNAYGTTLPANLRVISADVQVTSGGPGWAYAVVSDPTTNDVAVIGAQSIVPASAAPTCTFTVSPSSGSFSASGGSGSFTVTTGSGCSWAAISDSSWLTLTSATFGSGSATVSYSVAANLALTLRSGAIAVAGQTHTVTQQASTCTSPSAPVLTTPTTATSDVSYAVSWTATSAISSYELQEASDSAFTNPTTAQVSALSRAFTHSVSDPTSFYYRVRAVGSCSGRTTYSTWSSTGATAVVPLDAVLYVAAAAHATGSGGTNWRTDLEIHNPGTTPATYTLALLQREEQNTSPTTQSFSLDPGRATRYSDVLQLLFGFTGAATIRITPMSGEIMASARTYNWLASGNPQGFPEGSTFGQFIPGTVAAAAVATGQSARLVQLSQSTSTTQGFRTNLGLVSATGADVTVEVKLYKGDGTLLGTLSYTLPAYGFKQVDRIFGYVTAQDVPDGFAVLRTTTATSAFFAYASVIDNTSGDPIFIPAQVVGQ